ncbi:Hypothetical protein HDN1F_25970 [gamma proteobacterium HdN1]|nr:Hypothetical protein HDN1F_25970 [gamma proteobacterium HdN1]
MPRNSAMKNAFPKKLFSIATAVALCSTASLAQADTSDGKRWAVSAGWLHIMPQSDAQGVTGGTTAQAPLLGERALSYPQAGFEVQNTNTAGLIVDYLVDDNLSIELVIGLPPKMNLSGKGQIVLPSPIEGHAPITAANLDKFDKIATNDAYTPTVLGKYHFGTIQSPVRPYVGAGLMYAHFANIKADRGVNAELNNDPLLALLNLKLGPIKVEDAVAPVIIAGMDFAINHSWFASASVSYAHLSTEAELEIFGKTALSADAPTGVILRGKSDIEVNPLVTNLGVGMRF